MPGPPASPPRAAGVAFEAIPSTPGPGPSVAKGWPTPNLAAFDEPKSLLKSVRKRADAGLVPPTPASRRSVRRLPSASVVASRAREPGRFVSPIGSAVSSPDDAAFAVGGVLGAAVKGLDSTMGGWLGTWRIVIKPGA